MDNYYQILGVSPDASDETIRNRYRFLVKVYHPDRFPDPESARQAEEEMKKINEAYKVLSNPEKRKAYSGPSENSNGESNRQQNKSNEDAELEKARVYLAQLANKWHPKFVSIQPSLIINNLSERIVKQLVVILTIAYSSLKEAGAQNSLGKATEELKNIVLINAYLGAELGTESLPSGFQLKDLQFISAANFLTILQIVRGRASLNRPDFEKNIDQIAESIFEQTYDLCQLALEFGKNATQAKQNKPENEPNKQEPPVSNKTGGVSTNKKHLKVGYCQLCGEHSAIQHVQFKQIIGLLIYWQIKKIQGEFCAKCIEKQYWQMTGTTFLFGWWSIISLFFTPFYLLSNMDQYSNTAFLRSKSGNLSDVSSGWKVAFFLMAFLLVIGGCVWVAGALSASGFGVQDHNSGEVWSSPNFYATGEFVNQATVTPTLFSTEVYGWVQNRTKEAQQPGCKLWNSVTDLDAGKSVCVEGIITKAYWGDDSTFYMLFGERPNDFRIVVVGGYYYRDIVGKCVEIEGVVKTYNQMPYIEASDNLMSCE